MPAPASAPPILLVSQNYPPAIGGTAVLYENVYSRCHGVRVSVLTDAAETRRAARGAVADVATHPMATTRWGLMHIGGLLHHARTARAIRWQLARLGRGTVVHCGRVLPEGVAARLAATVGTVAHCHWVHGEDLATARQSRDLTITTRWVLQGAQRVFASSHNTGAMLAEFGVPDDRVTVIHPGVDAARFHPGVDGARQRAAWGCDPSSVVVLSVGRLQARKGHDVALRAVAALAPSDPRLRYVVVGSGEERDRLQRLTKELALGDRVRFVGDVEDAELPAYYAASDIFLLPNRVERGDFEGFGIVFLEAAASGRPVIGGASGGVPEAVADGRTGLLVDGANVGAVTDALEHLVRSPERRRQLGDAGRARAVDEFSWDAAAARLRAAHLD